MAKLINEILEEITEEDVQTAEEKLKNLFRSLNREITRAEERLGGYKRKKAYIEGFFAGIDGVDKPFVRAVDAIYSIAERGSYMADLNLREVQTALENLMEGNK